MNKEHYEYEAENILQGEMLHNFADASSLLALS